MTRNEILRRWPNASESTIKANLDTDIPSQHSGLRTNDPKPAKGNSLVSPVPGKAKSAKASYHGSRLRIRFTIYSVRPADWDGYSIKELQDLLVKASILGGDDWNRLSGEVISEKAHSKEEERTVVTIYEEPLQNQTRTTC